MSQVTWRVREELLEQVKSAAATQGRSMNEFLTHVLSAAVDPNAAGDDIERTRERLRRAGLLVEASRSEPASRPEPEALARARREAGRGTPLSEIVAAQRG